MPCLEYSTSIQQPQSRKQKKCNSCVFFSGILFDLWLHTRLDIGWMVLAIWCEHENESFKICTLFPLTLGK